MAIRSIRDSDAYRLFDVRPPRLRRGPVRDAAVWMRAVTVCGGEWRQGLGHDAAGWEAGRDRLRR
ncbi:hypothetical protein OWR29_10885 [Actinoplanes sp. Pm04-4]|uniref:GNAT family N-acetyltransferase n=1 Tax=Paractinoplanes pyxinae TaxID=2997416 RepID=A0ABT4AWA7_9ACTN|nr:hypothetical protein [Actinoplanes pyxinae]MCY1138503.1 hypothetical protein [Actinoplanes pyxinae]